MSVEIFLKYCWFAFFNVSLAPNCCYNTRWLDYASQRSRNLCKGLVSFHKSISLGQKIYTKKLKKKRYNYKYSLPLQSFHCGCRTKIGNAKIICGNENEKVFQYYNYIKSQLRDLPVVNIKPKSNQNWQFFCKWGYFLSPC